MILKTEYIKFLVPLERKAGMHVCLPFARVSLQSIMVFLRCEAKTEVENLWAAKVDVSVCLIVAHVHVTKSYVIAPDLENIGKFHNPFKLK